MKCEGHVRLSSFDFDAWQRSVKINACLEVAKLAFSMGLIASAHRVNSIENQFPEVGRWWLLKNTSVDRVGGQYTRLVSFAGQAVT